jgi:hypothetical protein
MTWAIVIWNLIFLYVIVRTITDNGSKACKGGQTCVDLTHIGQGIAVAGFTLLWFLGFVALLFTWFMTRPPRRVCPECGETVRPRPTCKKCGYDFNAVMSPVRSAEAPAAAADGTLDPADQIRKLASLRDDGLITAEEYEEKKKQLLGL